MKIDLVYLWVDGSDAQWLAKKNAELQKLGEQPKEAVSQNRFNDNDELLFSLRSVEKFASWVNHIFIVTDNQVPKWLSTSNPKVTIIDLTEIMPSDALPCFNSAVIEFFIANIPNLSEHFIYANDDMLFTAKTKPSYFFTKKGTPIVRICNKKKQRDRSKNLFPVGEKFEEQYKSGSINNSQILNAKKLAYDIVGEHNYLWECSHNIVPYIKSDLVKINKMPLVREKLEEAQKDSFRNKRNIHRILYHLIGIAKYGYKTVGRDSLAQIYQYLTLRFREQPLYTDDIRKYKSRNLLHRKLTCVQERADGKTTKSNQDYLIKMFPCKSEFEK